MGSRKKKNNGKGGGKYADFHLDTITIDEVSTKSDLSHFFDQNGLTPAFRSILFELWKLGENNGHDELPLDRPLYFTLGILIKNVRIVKQLIVMKQNFVKRGIEIEEEIKNLERRIQLRKEILDDKLLASSPSQNLDNEENEE